MRKYLVMFLILIIVFMGVSKLSTRTFSQEEIINNNFEFTYIPPEHLKEELYQDITMTLLLPHIYEAISEHYGKAYQFDLFGVEVLEAERTNHYRGFSFKMKMHIKPFIGAHNIIGEDHVTIRIRPGGTFVEKFEHIKSYNLPEDRIQLANSKQIHLEGFHNNDGVQ